MRLNVVGSGDAFGSGGRLQTSFHIETSDANILLDCGATALIGMERLQLNPNDVDAIVISHLHGDHFGGLVWWLLHAHYVSQRQKSLTILGPIGLEARLHAATEAFYPPAQRWQDLRFPLCFQTIAPDQPVEIHGCKVSAREVRHPCGAPPYALRLEHGAKVLAFSGDTEWVDELQTISRDADLFIIECHGFDAPVPWHMSWREISTKLDAITARRILLTHMSSEMLANSDDVQNERVLLAHDGLVLSV
ncbi:MAG: MBL fold metallo-hydrolase [Pseudomonadota bacterium]